MSASTPNATRANHVEGLEGIVACDSAISTVDGIAGILTYRGYDIHDLADHASFEEVVYLLWHDALPTRTQLDALTAEIVTHRALPAAMLDLLRAFPHDAVPMAVLRSAVSALAMFDEDAADQSPDANARKALRLLARVPTIITSFVRLRQGKDPVSPTDNPSIAYDFLTTLHGEPPSETERKALDIAFILQADHELNASTFAGRVTASTLADFYGATTAAVATLAGPLHGGANEDSIKLLNAVQNPEQAREYVQNALDHKQKIPGFGHRVYKAEDPRATHLREMARQVCEHNGMDAQFTAFRAMEEKMLEAKNIHANVDLYSGTVYRALDIADDLFTPVFAVARMSGWAAHILEQYAHNRIFRPVAQYIGKHGLHYVPMNERG